MPIDQFTLRWGILATGYIASQFAKDILSNPADRGVHDIVHKIVAIGSSSSIEKAQKFSEEIKAKSAKCYDNYDDLVNDPNVDVIYVATPHSHHYENAKSALNAGKHVLCEKPFTVNAAQAKILAALAKEKNRFLLEAVWTRFFPISTQIRNLISSGELGHIHLVFADLSFSINKEKVTMKHRMFNPDLAGGSLLDLGVYSLTWIMQTIYDAQKKRGEKPSVTGSLVPVEETGVDETAAVVLTWKDAIGIATSGVAVPTDGNGTASAGPAVKIMGTKATLTIPHPIFRPTEYTIHPHHDGKPERHVVDIPGKGMHWQADATARAIRIEAMHIWLIVGDGKLETEVLPVAETILMMEIMDRVREIGGLRYPDQIEKV